ncbi:MAG: phosphatase, partial [Armatimonadetes bacterium]|nr:phosphatase [Armatimonadota bacterium]
MEDVVAEAGGGQVGRPHMAKALVKQGVVASTQEAFDRYLADNAPCCIPKVKLTPVEAIDLIHLAGGTAVLAHPKYLEFPNIARLEQAIAAWRDAGLDGLECYYSQHSPEETELYLDIARRLDLVVSGGSDFHGDSKPHAPLGVVYRGGALADGLLEGLRARARRAQYSTKL